MGENSVPARSPEAGPLLPLALSALHISLLVTIAVVMLHTGGGLADGFGGLNTVVGFLLFALVWGVTWQTTCHATAGLRWREPPSLSSTMERGGYWGGVSGVIVVVALAAVILVLTTLDAIVGGQFTFDVAVFAGIIGYLLLTSIVAFAVGGLLGALFAALDRALLGLARAIVGEG